MLDGLRLRRREREAIWTQAAAATATAAEMSESHAHLGKVHLLLPLKLETSLVSFVWAKKPSRKETALRLNFKGLFSFPENAGNAKETKSQSL